jgi:hypothetical protein
MSGSERLRVLLVGALAALVMAGVVFAALRGRDSSAGAHDPDVVPTTLPPTRTGTSRRDAMPAGCETTETAPPDIAVDVPSGLLDLGARRQGEVLTRDVTVRNTGSGVLCIQDVATGCGCVKAEWLGDKHVPAGAAGTVRVAVDTAGREGRNEKSVTLYTNIRGRPAHQFFVRVDVSLGLMVGAMQGGLPSHYLQFGTHAPGQKATFRVRLKSPKDEPAWEVKSVASAGTGPPTAYAWELLPAEPGDPAFRCYDLVVTHPGRADLGTSTERVVVTTTHPQRPTLEFEAMLHVVTKFYASPSRPSFGFIRANDPSPLKTVYVYPGEAGAPFTVTGARVEGAGFTASAPRTTKEGYAVDVRYDGQARASGKITATLVISIDDPEMPVVKVPLEGHVMGP